MKSAAGLRSFSKSKVEYCWRIDSMDVGMRFGIRASVPDQDNNEETQMSKGNPKRKLNLEHTIGCEVVFTACSPCEEGFGETVTCKFVYFGKVVVVIAPTGAPFWGKE
jgi:hypothetical protein